MLYGALFTCVMNYRAGFRNMHELQYGFRGPCSLRKVEPVPPFFLKASASFLNQETESLGVRVLGFGPFRRMGLQM